jgi:hypothetical protein
MLFNDARRLATEGNYAEACPKFEESQRLDPGMGTQFNLADCYEHVGRIASAWGLFQDVAAAAKSTGQPARAQVATQRAAAIEGRVAHLTVVPPKGVSGLEVRRNGEMLGPVLWGAPMPVDPGSYTVQALAPGRKRWSVVAPVAPRAGVSVVIPPLLADAAATSASPPFAPRAAGTLEGATEPARPSGDDGNARGSTQRAAGAVVGVGGVVGLGVGAAFGLLSFSKHTDYVQHCTGNLCDATGVAGHGDAVTYGNVSTVAIIAGGVLVAAGAVLWFTAPKGPEQTGLHLTPLVGIGSAGVSLGGGWL